MVNSDLFWKVLGNTFWYVLLYVPITMVGSLLLALLVNRKLPAIKLFRTIYFLPVISSMVAVALIWSWLYNPEFGFINWTVKTFFGIEGPRWLLSTQWAMPAIAILSAWKVVGYNMVILLAGLQSVPKYLQESALIDGASQWRQFTTVTLPALSPTLFFVLIITLINSFQLFEQTYVLTQGGPANSTLTLSYYSYQNAFQFFRMGYAAAVAYVLFALTFIVTIIQFRLQKRWVFYG
ncbi:MAG: carbohydrate ABC transporter permease [Candidatus Kapaibacterium sp.]